MDGWKKERVVPLDIHTHTMEGISEITKGRGFQGS